MNTKEDKAARLFAPSSFGTFVREHARSPYVSVLLENFGETVNIPDAFEYGLSRLTDVADADLSAYFFLLSELRHQPEAVTSFALDVSLYCEDPDFAPVWPRDKLLDDYERSVKPLYSGGFTDRGS